MKTTGVVTGFQASNHEECKYTYTVSGHRYTASGHGGCSGPDLADPVISITYLPSHPATSEDAAPASELRNFAETSLGMATFLGVLFASPRGWRRKR
jgi:hypothetical protein